jgi:hypothetical protein
MINEINPRCVKLLSEKGYIIFENNEDICFHIFRTFFYLSNVYCVIRRTLGHCGGVTKK